MFYPGLLGLVAVDQLSKLVAGEWGRVVINRGGVWGLFPGNWWLIIVSLIWIGLAWYCIKWKQTSVGMGLILAGGLSNLLDRVIWGYVRDFIFYPGIGVYGNIADIILLIGVVWIFWQKMKA
jgi:signal peptidase II